jgi:predicted Rossmann fold nucleotide-binding protein DprA/Smf involved in DNA uptake
MTQLTPDGQVIALLCSRIALPKDADEPLTNSEWNRFAAALAASELKTPAALLDTTARRLSQCLGLDEPFGARIHGLLARGGQFALALDQLADRGIWVLTTAESLYPEKLKERLQHRAPAVLFGSGRPQALSGGGVAVLGSRDADDESAQFAVKLGEQCARAAVAVISGGARGIDRLAMNAALENAGTAVGVLADSLERVIRESECRRQLLSGRLTLVTPFHYGTPFSVGVAMARNKVVYCLADFAVVVATSPGTGGTWAGAVENLKARWVPLLVRTGPGVPAGNDQLIAQGALPIAGHPAFDELQAAAASWGEKKARTLWEEPPSGAPSLSPEAPSPEPAAPAPEPMEIPESAGLFRIVWPHVQGHLAQPRKETEIADAFVLHPAQAKKWIQLACELKLAQVKKSGNTKTYVATSEGAPHLPAFGKCGTTAKMPEAGVADLFPLVWPHLSPFLSEPRKPKDIASAFGLESAQVRQWLDRAVADHLARKSKPGYTAQKDSQAALFAHPKESD